MKRISVVVPCYNEQESLPFFYQEIVKIADSMAGRADFEFLFINDGSCDDTLLLCKKFAAIISTKEYNRFSKGLFAWVGFETKWLEYVDTERVAGNTKWSFFSLFLYAMQGIISFSIVPLALASILGFLFCSLSFMLICIIIAKTLLWGDPVAG